MKKGAIHYLLRHEKWPEQGSTPPPPCVSLWIMNGPWFEIITKIVLKSLIKSIGHVCISRMFMFYWYKSIDVKHEDSRWNYIHKIDRCFSGKFVSHKGLCSQAQQGKFILIPTVIVMTTTQCPIWLLMALGRYVVMCRDMSGVSQFKTESYSKIKKNVARNTKNAIIWRDFVVFHRQSRVMGIIQFRDFDFLRLQRSSTAIRTFNS